LRYNKFINRKKELKLLEELYGESSSRLVVLYGKRRVGKTALLNEFASKHKILYFVARQESMIDQLKKMSEEVGEYFGDDVIKINPFTSYDALFKYLIKNPSPVFFDEFPFLVESCKALPSILQEYWDKYFSKRDSFFVLCGSSIRMMVSLLGYKSPIYGRRTAQMLLEPLSFKQACEFFPRSLSNEDKVINYAVLGGTPAYLLEFDYKKNIYKNILEKILKKNVFLYQDVMFVLQQELNEPRVYYSIIQSIAKGNTKLAKISNDTKIDAIKISKYLSVLQELHLIERRVPITEKNKEKSKKGLYKLKDQYFKFWFKFIFGNKDFVERNKEELLVLEKIKPNFNAYVGEAFEEVVLQWASKKEEFKRYFIGRWWSKEEEIDLLGVDRIKKKMLFGEVKWKRLSPKQVKDIFEDLERKSLILDDSFSKEFMVVGKKISEKKRLREEGYKVFDLDDVV